MRKRKAATRMRYVYLVLYANGRVYSAYATRQGALAALKQINVGAKDDAMTLQRVSVFDL